MEIALHFVTNAKNYFNWLRSGTSNVVIGEQVYQTVFSEFDFHWLSHTSGLVLIKTKLSKLQARLFTRR